VVDALVDRRKPSAWVAIEVDVFARRVLLPDRVIDRKTGEDQHNFIDVRCGFVRLAGLKRVQIKTRTYSISCLEHPGTRWGLVWSS